MGDERRNKHWTPEEDAVLVDYWGSSTMKTICSTLHRSPRSVMYRAKFVLKLGSMSEHATMPTLGEVICAVYNIEGASTYMEAWRRHGVPVHYVRFLKRMTERVDIDEFWRWAETQQKYLNFARMEENVLGREPAWVKAKRKADQRRQIETQRWQKWTPTEDSKLAAMLRTYRYTAADLARKLRRSEGAVKARIQTLKLRERPIWRNDKSWSSGEVTILLNGIRSGKGYAEMKQKLPCRSMSSIRRRLFVLYDTSNITRLRQKLGVSS